MASQPYQLIYQLIVRLISLNDSNPTHTFLVIPLGPASSLGRVILAPLTLSCAYAIFVPRENAEKGGVEVGEGAAADVAGRR